MSVASTVTAIESFPTASSATASVAASYIDESHQVSSRTSSNAQESSASVTSSTSSSSVFSSALISAASALTQRLALEWSIGMSEQERVRHERYMGLALEQAALAVHVEEVPVGCILLHMPTDTVIARAFNRTNIEKNVSVSSDFSSVIPPNSVALLYCFATRHCEFVCTDALLIHADPAYGCVYFGCANERFGGCGSIYSLHLDKDKHPIYPCAGGIRAAEAIQALKEFYARGNPNAPEHKRQRPLARRNADSSSASQESMNEASGADHSVR